MNDREERVARAYSIDGWTVIRNGAPDFFVRKGRRLVAVEVKAPKDALRPEQEDVRRALMGTGIEYRIERPDGDSRFSEGALREAAKRRAADLTVYEERFRLRQEEADRAIEGFLPPASAPSESIPSSEMVGLSMGKNQRTPNTNDGLHDLPSGEDTDP